MKCSKCNNQARRNSEFCFDCGPKKIATKRHRNPRRYRPIEQDRRRAPETPVPMIDPLVPKIIDKQFLLGKRPI